MPASSSMLAEAAIKVLFAFGVIVVGYVVWKFKALFTPRHGRRHRVSGGLYLAWILGGVVEASYRRTSYLAFDVVLGVLGLVTTVSAASDFRSHAKTQAKSGTLDETATVSVSEMVEHAFYQFLNLGQVLFLHACTRVDTLPHRLLLLAAVTAPWLARGFFPVNSFSANYSTFQKETNVMYFVKKCQYLLYKHALLHGLNCTVALGGRVDPNSLGFRAYWLGLNLSYTMEFFLQTLVKRKHMRQRTMLLLNKLLMLAATLAAVNLLVKSVDPLLAAASCALNFANRHHELTNTAIVVSGGMVIKSAGFY